MDSFALDKTEKKMIAAIEDGDIGYFKKHMDIFKTSDFIFSNNKPAISYAMNNGKAEICRFMLDQGTNPNLIISKSPLLIEAIKQNQLRIVRYLIEFGADINYQDKKKNTPLMIAARLHHSEICKALIDRGANPMAKNAKNKKASDFARAMQPQGTKEYLLQMEKKYLEADAVSSFKDGPYIIFEDKNKAVLKYYERFREKNLTRLFEKTYVTNGKDIKVKGIRWDKNNTYEIQYKMEPTPAEIKADGKIFAIGDVHGKYNALVNLLRNNKIIDEENNWIFGNGHLVFLGDVFDRGDMVTETLWLLYHLQIKARKAGGDLHLLLGNHEVMALIGDHRYVHEKYTFFNQYNYSIYFENFYTNTLLGKWLRSQNLILKINDNLFLHAGISPEFYAKNIPDSTVNNAMRETLDLMEQIEKGSVTNITLSAYGPLWYRGYKKRDTLPPEIPKDFVFSYLKERKLSRMIIGHNEQKLISRDFDGKVFSIDVFIDESGKSAQGLLIKGDKVYRCYSDGHKELLE